MIGGFMILASAYGVWRSGAERRLTGAMAVAVALLPVQVWLGAQTVLAYTFLALTAHFVTALVIFGAVVLSTLWFLGPQAASLGRLRYALLGVVALYPLLLALSPGGLVAHTAAVQAVYYAVGLAAFAALLAAVAWAGLLQSSDSDDRIGRVRALAGVGSVLLGVQLLLGRYLYTELIQLLDATLMATVFLLAAVAAWLTYRVDAAAIAPEGASRTDGYH
jgi:cytochrome c oxidase assembly protein subunit 15